MARTYTVHGHIKRRDGRQEALWTRTGLTKSAAQKLAKEQRAESGGTAKIVPEEDPASTRHHATRKKSHAQLDREIAETLARRGDDPALKIGDAVQLRWEPGTGGVIRRLESEGGQRWAQVATSRGERKVPTDALRRVRKEHEPRVQRAVETQRHHSTRAGSEDLEPRYTLTADQLDALRTFAKANGRSWKSKLNVAWSTGRYNDYPGTDDYGTLQEIRNMFGPSWLVKLRLDNAKTHSVQH
jgi:hypothetical protein